MLLTAFVASIWTKTIDRGAMDGRAVMIKSPLGDDADVMLKLLRANSERRKSRARVQFRRISEDAAKQKRRDA